ncbi:hypothetical protein MMC31_003184 [Peltigera leucophlebia]|nr:hypothetical protein [Peltigera leucophlebia]
MDHKIRVFRGLRNNCEDPADFLKALDRAYRLDYKLEEPVEDNAKKESQEETMKMLFSSQLSGKAEDWCNDLEIEEKGNTRTKLFDLKMKLTDFKQQTDESRVADYLERAANLVTKFPTEEFNIGIATVRGVNNQKHQEWIEREYRRFYVYLSQQPGSGSIN